MLYAVGTHIDLRYLNDKTTVDHRPEPSSPAFYPIGTKIVFLNLASSLQILKVQARPA